MQQIGYHHCISCSRTRIYCCSYCFDARFCWGRNNVSYLYIVYQRNRIVSLLNAHQLSNSCGRAHLNNLRAFSLVRVAQIHRCWINFRFWLYELKNDFHVNCCNLEMFWYLFNIRWSFEEWFAYYCLSLYSLSSTWHRRTTRNNSSSACEVMHQRTRVMFRGFVWMGASDSHYSHSNVSKIFGCEQITHKSLGRTRGCGSDRTAISIIGWVWIYVGDNSPL